MNNDTPIAQWGILITIVLASIGTLYSKIMDSRKERLSQQIQTEQRDCLRQIEKSQAYANGKLAEVTKLNQGHYNSVIEISRIRHDELLRALQGICKAQPVVVNQVNKTTEEIK